MRFKNNCKQIKIVIAELKSVLEVTRNKIHIK